MQTTAEIGRKLVEYCKQGKNLDAIAALYSPEIISIEVCGDENMPRRMQGIDAVRGKNQWWFENNEFHGGEVVGPFPHDNRFIVMFSMDVTAKAGPCAGQRMKMQEAGLYTVKDGKIVQKEFFYDMPG